MSILVVGSVATDRIETPFGKVDRTLGGAATYFSASASLFQPVRLVGVIGSDFPEEELTFLEHRGVDLSGLERAEGESFFWSGRCLLYTSDAADDLLCVDLGGRRI